MAETMIAVDGGDVWADDSGGDGPPLVLLHPGVGDSRIWEANLQAAARIPGCQLTLVPGLDHLPPLRAPDLVLRTIRSTLSRADW